MKKILSFCFILLVCSCSNTKNAFYSSSTENWAEVKFAPNSEPIHTLFLIGDAGYKKDGNENPVLSEMKKMLLQESKKSSVVFLGDQIYPSGLPNKKNNKRKHAESILSEQLDILKDYKGKGYFIAGERDWEHRGDKGLKALKRQEDFIKEYFDKKNKARLFPHDGCADPKVVKIQKDLIFVFLDTQWWLQDWDDEGKINDGCEIKSRHDLLDRIKEILTDHKNDQVVMMMHHPIKSNGIHAGKGSFKDHIFPLSENKNLWIPMPIVGTLIQNFRNISGTKQDMANVHYKELMNGINNIALGLRSHVLFTSAHDHGLQHFDNQKLQYIVSGAGSKTSNISKDGGASFASSNLGFCKVSFYKEFEMWMEFYQVDPDRDSSSLVYRFQMRAPRPGSEKVDSEPPSIAAIDTVHAANAKFAAGKFKQLFMGDQYREMWATPIRVPMINLETELGGLVPIKKGGGMSSNSLRMEVENGNNYILRSIIKDYRKLLPPSMVKLKAVNIAADQNSASHPYGALIIPTLSKAAGVYYTEPQVVYLKHQKGLGNYNSQFPQELYLLEQRPSGDWSHASQFGNSSEIIGYSDVLVNLREGKNQFVDQKWVCKSRMFDLFIHDWDRHDDQWRWASFKEEGKTIYRPIPRDRDQAFYRFNGLIMKFISCFIAQQMKGMKGNVKDVKHLAFNARTFDRYFMNELEWSEWEEIIKELQTNVTDESIAEAMLHFPEEVRCPHDEELTALLKSRRANWLEIGKRLYDFLSKEVEISGTDHADQFKVKRFDDGSVRVKWFVKKKKNRILKYERTFYPNETKEIRLYGLRGKDDFEINGADFAKIKIRIIGGEDKDELLNDTSGGKLYAYDEPDGIKLKGPNIKDKTSNEIEVNEYNRKGFQYDTDLPMLSFGYTLDDGFWLGGSYSWTNHAWRKSPFKSKQAISLSFAPASTNAAQFGYSGLFPNAIGKLWFAPSAKLNFPYYENYFGLGNKTINQDLETQFNWVRMEEIEVNPMLQFHNNKSQFTFGPKFKSVNIVNSTDRVSEDLLLGFGVAELESRQFVGGEAAFLTGFKDNKVSPNNGIEFKLGFEYLHSLKQEENAFNFMTGFTSYIKLLNKPSIVLGNSIGFEKAWGDLQFYQYNDLGGNHNLRGFRNNRFRGQSLFYHNIDLRVELFDWNNNILPMTIGLVGGYDYGRVWLDGEDADNWHSSQTIGLSMNVLGFVVIHPFYSFTNEGNLFSLKLGYNF